MRSQPMVGIVVLPFVRWYRSAPPLAGLPRPAYRPRVLHGDYREPEGSTECLSWSRLPA